MIERGGTPKVFVSKSNIGVGFAVVTHHDGCVVTAEDGFDSTDIAFFKTFDEARDFMNALAEFVDGWGSD